MQRPKSHLLDPAGQRHSLMYKTDKITHDSSWKNLKDFF